MIAILIFAILGIIALCIVCMVFSVVIGLGNGIVRGVRIRHQRKRRGEPLRQPGPALTQRELDKAARQAQQQTEQPK